MRYVCMEVLCKLQKKIRPLLLLLVVIVRVFLLQMKILIVYNPYCTSGEIGKD